MALEPVIGLEVHIQLKTDSKMFCSCENIFGDVAPNSAICPICLGYPGTLPTPNNTAIEWTQKLGSALHCELAAQSKFDRKSYFYPDLPKGYQISQFDQPFCGEGKITVTVDGKEHTIGITRIHLEEDAAKNIHSKDADHTLVDYNRAGTPLAELVTEPDIKSPAEAKAFLQELQRIVRALGISDADMEKGQMRCDANISLREEGSTEFNPKTEVKNVNSFRFVEKALKYEIERQQKAHAAGEIPQQATRGFDSKAGKTYEQRTKEGAADYRYFPEPDIPPFTFKMEYLKDMTKQVGELPTDKKERFMRQYGIGQQQAELLVAQDDLAYFFEDTVSEIKQMDKERVDVAESSVPSLVSRAISIITREVRDVMAKEGATYETTKITAENLAELVALIENGKVGRGSVAQVVAEMQKTGGDPDPIIAKLGLEQVGGADEIETYVDQVISENPDVVEKVSQGKDSAIQFLMGQVMAKSAGKANPGAVIELLKKKLATKED